jgi:tRNA A37 N6-isopentenylltransferase MiaA
VQKVICWTPGGKTVGGTATAIRLAERNQIEVINLAITLAR